MRYTFIKANCGQWAVSLLAQVLAVSVSGFYDWLRRGKSKRAEEDGVLTEKIVMFHCGSRCTYGSPRIHKDLKAAGHNVGRKRVARLMRNAALRGKTKRKFKTTTISQHQRPRAENLVQQNFDVTTPNTLWASDVSYISTSEGWLYLAVTLDLFSRKVVGWAFSDRLSDSLPLTALEMATQQRFYPGKPTSSFRSADRPGGGASRTCRFIQARGFNMPAAGLELHYVLMASAKACQARATATVSEAPRLAVQRGSGKFLR